MKTRNILAVVVGVVVSFVIIILGEGITHAINPLPAGLDMTDADAFREYVSNAPVKLHLEILLVYAIGSFLGALITSSIATEKKMPRAMTLGGIIMGIGTYSLVSVGHPIWVVIISFFVFLPCAYLGGMIALRNAKKKNIRK
ncbi:MAG: hypothetical protein ACJ77K_07670 [Bacteroidia bacterium]